MPWVYSQFYQKLHQTTSTIYSVQQWVDLESCCSQNLHSGRAMRGTEKLKPLFFQHILFALAQNTSNGGKEQKAVCLSFRGVQFHAVLPNSEEHIAIFTGQLQMEFFSLFTCVVGVFFFFSCCCVVLFKKNREKQNFLVLMLSTNLK